MNSAKAIYLKQLKDIFKNKSMLIQYIMYPAIAFLMTELIAKPDENIPNTLFIIMFSSMFIGMALIMGTASPISEDREHKSLRFLIMAGVKPHQYLLGLGGVIFSGALLVSLVFALMGGYTSLELLKFMTVMSAGALGSIILGAIIGMISKNQQAAIGLGLPMAMIFGFSPMIASFNETAKNYLFPLYTQQISLAVNDLSAPIWQPLLVIAANILVFLVLFVIAYRKKGIKS